MKSQNKKAELYITPEFVVFYFDFTQDTPDLFGEIPIYSARPPHAWTTNSPARATRGVGENFVVEEAKIAPDRETIVAVLDS